MSTTNNIQEILKKAVELGASDIFIVAGRPASMRINGTIRCVSPDRLTSDDTNELVNQIYSLEGRRNIEDFYRTGDDDFAFAVPGLSRFRVSAYKQRGACSAVVRVINFELPDPNQLGITDSIMQLADCSKGLVLVTGPAGSGKSTTLACIIDRINKTMEKHIITLEDPLEHLHRHDKSIVSQREVNVDTESYVTALRSALRQSPDVILLGEMRDYETISVAMTAAETGHMIFSTLHTIGAANTIDRIIDVFPPNQQRQIAVQLSMVLQAVVTQQLVPSVNGDLIPAFEIMTVTPAIRNMIREHKTPQIDGLIYSSSGDTMMSMDACLARLHAEGKITEETALQYASNPEMLSRKLK